MQHHLCVLKTFSLLFTALLTTAETIGVMNSRQREANCQTAMLAHDTSAHLQCGAYRSSCTNTRVLTSRASFYSHSMFMSLVNIHPIETSRSTAYTYERKSPIGSCSSSVIICVHKSLMGTLTGHRPSDRKVISASPGTWATTKAGSWGYFSRYNVPYFSSLCCCTSNNSMCLPAFVRLVHSDPTRGSCKGPGMAEKARLVCTWRRRIW